jgi:DNA (cytosine-5)-methyltransferase 1
VWGQTVFEFYEFFAGGGMARAGLGKGWACTFANDFDGMKAATYDANWAVQDPAKGSGHFLSHMHCCDVATVTPAQLPGVADLAWASFPCQDLSLAGDYKGLGRQSDKVFTRSGTFWPFWDLMRGLAKKGRAPKTIVLENVYGALTSRGGRDFAALCSALSESGYRFGAVVINAALFVPHSRPRVFVVAVRRDVHIPESLLTDGPSERWHPDALLYAHGKLTADARAKWHWWKLPAPKKRKKTFGDLIEAEPTGVEWDTPETTKRLLGMMSAKNRAKVAEAKKSGKRMIGGVYKRTRLDDAGVKAQRAEVRFDDIAGCLRTPSGGSSRQRILVIEGEHVRSRLLSPREAMRLMGLPDTYKVPRRYNDAYHVAGDGVVVPVVRHIAKHIVEPLLQAQEMRQAAE